jgi:hypothetical protein
MQGSIPSFLKPQFLRLISLGTDVCHLHRNWRGKWNVSAIRVRTILGLNFAVSSVGHGQDYEDPYFEWEDYREIYNPGAILFQPDRSMAWRSKMVEADCEATLLAVLGEFCHSIRNHDQCQIAFTFIQSHSIKGFK